MVDHGKEEFTMTTLHLLAYAIVLDDQLRAYLAKSATCGGPYATDAHQWLERWHDERGIPFKVPQRVCSEWMRAQGLIGPKHAVMYTASGRSSNLGQRRRAECEAKERRRQYRAEKGHRDVQR